MDPVKNSLSFYAWHAAAFRADTQHLTRDERHAYRDILDEIFVAHQDSCSMPGDDSYVCRVVGRTIEEWQSMKYALLEGPRKLLKLTRGRIHQARLTLEIRKAQGKAAGQARGGSEGRSKQLRGNPGVSPDLPGEIKIEIKTKEEEKTIPNSSPKLVTRPGAELAGRLRDEGLSVTGAQVKVVAKWEADHGADAVIGAFIENRATILDSRVERPLAYFGAILNAPEVVTRPRAVESSLTVGAHKEQTLRDRMMEGVILPYTTDPDTLRPLNAGPARNDWNAAFEAHFGFTVEQWDSHEVSDAAMERWLGVSA